MPEPIASPPQPPRTSGAAPARALVTQLTSSIRDLLGDGASREALRRFSEATEASDGAKALLWFDVWTQLEKPLRRR